MYTLLILFLLSNLYFVFLTLCSIHMFQLLKHGYIRKLVSNLKDSYLLVTEISFGFEIAAKFLYGFHFELSTKNISMVRCNAPFI